MTSGLHARRTVPRPRVTPKKKPPDRPRPPAETSRHGDTSPERDIAVLEVDGDIDLATAPALLERGLALLARGHRHLVLDMSAVDYADPSGINAVLDLLYGAHDRRGTLRLIHVPDRLERQLRLTGLAELVVTTSRPGTPTAEDSAPRPPTEAHAVSALDPRRGNGSVENTTSTATSK